jgi:hypothetical protein
MADYQNSVGGLSVPGPVICNNLAGGVSAVATIASSGTIASTLRVELVTVAGAVTAVVLQPGQYNGQYIHVINQNTTASNTITMAASGTSNVALGTAVVISGLNSKDWIWDAATSLWW